MYFYGEDLTTISTFDLSGVGGDFEEDCQKMLWLGANYISEIDFPAECFQGVFDIKNSKYPKRFYPIKNYIEEHFKGATDAKYAIIIKHMEFLAKKGYPEWHAELTLIRPAHERLKFSLDEWKLVFK